MKIFKVLIVLFLLLIPSVLFAQMSFPNYDGYVNDFENILNNDEELEAKLTAFEKESTVEIVIVTVEDFDGTTIEDYAVKLFEAWKIGKADVDNGLLILVSANERRARIEVGYGIEGVLPDSLAGRVQDEYMIPAFVNGDYTKGVSDSVDVLIGIIKEDPTVISSLNNAQSDSGNFDVVIMLLLFSLYIMAVSKSWWLGGVIGLIAGLYFAYQSGSYILPFITTPLGLFIDFILSKTPVGRAVVHGMHLVGSSSSRGGGGISFGGGSSGGGGSSRSW